MLYPYVKVLFQANYVFLSYFKYLRPNWTNMCCYKSAVVVGEDEKYLHVSLPVGIA